jgi:GNAT superfamily N-acetyltransferase
MGEVTPFPAAAEGPKLSPPERLRDGHDLTSFDCGKPELNEWLTARARTNEGRTARTFVAAVDGRVVGYYCLAAGSVMREELPTAKARQNTPEPVPVIVIGRLATDKKFQGRGFGMGLLKDAILRALTTADSIGVRAIIVHAKDEDGVAFYKKFGFLVSPMNARTLVLTVETAKQAIAG